MVAARNVETFQSILNSTGAEAALAYLNAGVPHRYTAAYRLLNGHFHNVFLHDKQGEIRPAFLEVVPFESSFCQFVLREGKFTSDNTALDSRLDGHIYQGMELSYHGVPLVSASGEIIGTLCHFDAAQHHLLDEEFELLQQAARALAPVVERQAITQV